MKNIVPHFIYFALRRGTFKREYQCRKILYLWSKHHIVSVKWKAFIYGAYPRRLLAQRWSWTSQSQDPNWDGQPSTVQYTQPVLKTNRVHLKMLVSLFLKQRRCEGIEMVSVYTFSILKKATFFYTKNKAHYIKKYSNKDSTICPSNVYIYTHTHT